MAARVLVVHLVLFMLACIGAFITAIPTIITLVDFEGECILYTTGTWSTDNCETAPICFHVTFGNKGNCFYGVFGSFGVSFFSLFMAVVTFYLLCNRHGNRNFPVFLPLVGNIIGFLMVFIDACIISVGLKTFCDSIMKGRQVKRCSQVQTNFVVWHDGNISRFHDMLQISMFAAWGTAIIYLVLSIIAVIRLRRDILGTRVSRKRQDLEPISHITDEGSPSSTRQT